MIAGIGVVDWIMLAVLVVSLVVGLVRGLTFELMALAGWLVAFFAAQWFAADVAALLPLANVGPATRLLLAFALVFVATLIAWSLLARLLRLLVHATPLSVIDRVGGGAFGLLRGVVVLLVLSTLVGFTSASQSASWRASLGAGWLAQARQAIQPLLPDGVRQWLPASTRI